MIKEELRRDDIGKESRDCCVRDINRDTSSHIASMTGTSEAHFAINEDGTKPVLKNIYIYNIKVAAKKGWLLSHRSSRNSRAAWTES